MKSGFDINQIRGDGYLIVPLSMARLAKEQNQKNCYAILDHFIPKLQTLSNDVIFLYTNGIYFNTEEISFENRKKTNQQMINHSIALRKLIQKSKKYVPHAFHFLPADYVILNSPQFEQFFIKLKKLEKKDKKFRDCIKKDIGERPYSEANVNFILEEVAITHIIRQHLVDLPKTLVKNDIWRLIVYPGKYMQTDLYQWKYNLLPKPDTTNPYAGAQYDFETKKLFVFNDI